MPDSMEHLWSTAHISGGNAVYVEELYDSYLHDPSAIPQEWREYFDQLPRVSGSSAQDTPHSAVKEQFRLLAKYRRPMARLIFLRTPRRPITIKNKSM